MSYLFDKYGNNILNIDPQAVVVVATATYQAGQSINFEGSTYVAQELITQGQNILLIDGVAVPENSSATRPTERVILNRSYRRPRLRREEVAPGNTAFLYTKDNANNTEVYLSENGISTLVGTYPYETIDVITEIPFFTAINGVVFTDEGDLPVGASASRTGIGIAEDIDNASQPPVSASISGSIPGGWVNTAQSDIFSTSSLSAFCSLVPDGVGSSSSPGNIPLAGNSYTKIAPAGLYDYDINISSTVTGDGIIILANFSTLGIVTDAGTNLVTQISQDFNFTTNLNSKRLDSIELGSVLRSTSDNTTAGSVSMSVTVNNWDLKFRPKGILNRVENKRFILIEYFDSNKNHATDIITVENDFSFTTDTFLFTEAFISPTDFFSEGFVTKNLDYLNNSTSLSRPTKFGNNSFFGSNSIYSLTTSAYTQLNENLDEGESKATVEVEVFLNDNFSNAIPLTVPGISEDYDRLLDVSTYYVE